MNLALHSRARTRNARIKRVRDDSHAASRCASSSPLRCAHSGFSFPITTTRDTLRPSLRPAQRYSHPGLRFSLPAFCSSGRPAALYWAGRPEAFGLGVILNVAAGFSSSFRPGRNARPRGSGLPAQARAEKSRGLHAQARQEERRISLRLFSPPEPAAQPPRQSLAAPKSSLLQKHRLFFSTRCALLCEPRLRNGPLFSCSCALLLPQLPCFDTHATCPGCFFQSQISIPAASRVTKKRKNHDQTTA